MKRFFTIVCFVLIFNQTNAQVTVDLNNPPPDFPMYHNTDSSIEDDHNYQLAVREWIKAHPDQYLDFMNNGVDILQFKNKSVASNTTNIT